MEFEDQDGDYEAEIRDYVPLGIDIYKQPEVY